MSPSIRRRPARGVPAAFILLGALALVSSGCQLVESLAPSNPRPVDGLSAAGSGSTLIVSWTNPVDFKALRVEVFDERGRMVETGKMNSAPHRQGPAMTAVRGLPPGTYRVEMASDVSSDGTKVARSAPVTAAIAEPVKQYIGLADLGLSAVEDLDVVYLIHPRLQAFAAGAAAAGRPPMESTFRQVAANVLSEVFRSAIPLQSGDDVIEIEKQGQIITREIFKQPIWLLNPAAVVVVDFRRAGGAAGGQQLHIRIHDLRLARLLNLDYAKLGLHNTRALVVEGYAEVGSFSTAGEDMVVALRDAWTRVLREALASARYGTYKKALEELRATDKLSEADQALVETLFFGKVPELLWPYREGAENTAEKVRVLERSVLFGPLDESRKPAGGATSGPGPGGGSPAPEKREGTP